MLYEAKKGSKAYEFIKNTLEAEEKEYKAYTERVKQAVGFDFEKYQGYQPNRSLLREYQITAIWILSEKYEELDKKVWRKVDSMRMKDGYYIAVAPNKRSKQGKAIAAALTSYKATVNHFQVIRELGVAVPESRSFSITQLLRHGDYIFVYLDDSIRAEKKNSDLKEIAMGEYWDIVNSNSEMEV